MLLAYPALVQKLLLAAAFSTDTGVFAAVVIVVAVGVAPVLLIPPLQIQVSKFLRGELTTVTGFKDNSEGPVRMPTVSVCPYHGYRQEVQK